MAYAVKSQITHLLHQFALGIGGVTHGYNGAMSTVLGNRVLLSRRDLDMKQGELARRIGVSRPYISRIETGAADNITVDVLVKLASVLGVPVSYLVGQTDAPTATDDGAPIDAGSSHLTFDVRDPELRALMVEIADLVHGMTPAQRRYFIDQVRLMRRLIEEDDSRAKNPIIIG